MERVKYLSSKWTSFELANVINVNIVVNLGKVNLLPAYAVVNGQLELTLLKGR